MFYFEDAPVGRFEKRGRKKLFNEIPAVCLGSCFLTLLFFFKSICARCSTKFDRFHSVVLGLLYESSGVRYRWGCWIILNVGVTDDG